MRCTDVIAYHADGCVVCPACISAEDKDNEEVSPIFADQLDSEVGATCDTCGDCLDDNGDWVNRREITDKRYYRGSRCHSCGDQRPHEINSFYFRQNRYDALRHRLVCRNCLKPDVHF